MGPLELAQLSPATRQLVQDVRHRGRLTSDLLRADPSSQESMHARDTIDAAVVEILAAAGLPRGPINKLVAESFRRGWFGRKAEDCRLLIDVGEFALLPGDARSDSLLKTWVHESLHARQPYAAGFRQEWRDVAGFEEGMVEGLTHAAVIDLLGLQPAVTSYRYYVAAYRSLAAALEIDIEQFWRVLWPFPPEKSG